MGWRKRLLWSTMAVVMLGAAAGVPAQQASHGAVEIEVGLDRGEVQRFVPGDGRTAWFKDCPQCPEMVVVPAGSFDMGAGTIIVGPTMASGRQVIARPFAVGRFAVTFAEWDACVAAAGCNGFRPDDNGWGRGRRPVINVSAVDADAYVQWLARMTGRPYRLLTDAEREYVARAGTGSAYWWGDEIDLDHANYDVPRPARRMPGVDYREIERVRGRTEPVDSFAANPWGLFNVHGNVWEWTSDCWREPYAPAAAGGTCGERVSRGGSWNDFAEQARSDSRMGFNATSRNPLQGFRVARDLATPPSR